MESVRRKLMAGELVDHFSGRSKFAHYRRHRFEEAAKLLPHQRFTSREMSPKIDEETGKFLREDLRKDGATAIELSLADEILSRLEEEKPSQFPCRNEQKVPKIEEVAMPTQIRRWDASLSGLTAFFAPIGKCRTFSLTG